MIQLTSLLSGLVSALKAPHWAELSLSGHRSRTSLMYKRFQNNNNKKAGVHREQWLIEIRVSLNIFNP